jgi:hypothetical protein
VGYKLYREIRDFAPYDWKPYMRHVAEIIADDANDRTRRSWIQIGLLCERTGYSPRMIRHALARLGEAGFEFRVSHGTGKDGREVYAARSHSVDYLVPHMPKGGNRVPPLPIPLPVDNPAKGGNSLPPSGAKGGNGLPPVEAKGGNRLPERRQRVAAPPLNPLISMDPEVQAAVEGNASAPGQNHDHHQAHVMPGMLPRPPTPAELAAAQVAQSRRKREAAERTRRRHPSEDEPSIPKPQE